MHDFGFIDEDDEALAAAALTKRSLVDTTERLGAMLDVMPIGVLIHTEQGILFANQEACRLLHAKAARLTGQHLLDYIRADGVEAVAAQLRSAFAEGGEPIQREAVAELPDGTVCLLKLITGRLPWPGVPVVQVLFQDITDQKRAEISLRQMAITDELTGAFNRRQAHYEAALYIGQDGAARVPLSLVMVDIDRFKSINDTYGHGVGDEVLKELTRVAHGFVPTIAGADSAFFARMGGEEFIFMLPGLELEGAQAAAEQFRRLTEGLRVQVDAAYLAFTISAGVATYRATDKSLDGLMERADQALYRAKELGRNRVETAL